MTGFLLSFEAQLRALASRQSNDASTRCHRLVLLLALLVPWQAQAIETCVGTSGALLSAIQVASSTPADHVINIERGLYSIPNGFTYAAGNILNGGSLSLRGGFDNGCTGRVINPANTVLHGQGAASAEVYFSGLRNDVEIDALMFYATRSVVFSSPDCPEAAPGTVRLRRMRVDASTGSGSAVTLAGGCTDFRLENLLVVNSAGGGVSASLNMAKDLSVVHSTLVNNAQTGLAVIYAHPASSLKVSNSIFWGNGEDLYTDVQIRADFNIFGPPTGSGSVVGAPNSNVNPQLDANYEPIEPLSPAINSGGTNPNGGLPATDILGRPRNVDGVPDRGAFETGSDGSAGILTVTNTNDAGVGSLRAAMDLSNGTGGRQLIQFNIPGPCAHTISLSSALPTLIDEVLVDGYTQPGSTPNTTTNGFNGQICIVLKSATTPGSSLAAGMILGGGQATIRGLAFSGFDAADAAAIWLQAGSGHSIEGNQFAGSAGGVTLLPSRDNIRIAGPAGNSTIGGIDAAQSNLIGNAMRYGVHILAGANGNQVLGNTIGASATSTSAQPNFVGVHLLQAPSNVVAGNLISGNTSHGIWISGANSDDNEISNNRIGLKGIAFCIPLPCTPVAQLPNGGHGILIEGAPGDPIFSAPSGTSITQNTIAYNGGDGVWVRAGGGHRISSSFYDNGELGIDLGADGSDPNDDDSAPEAALLANRGKNAPVIISATGGSQIGLASGSFSSIAGSYVIDAFANPSCDPSGRGEARTSVGAVELELVGGGQITANWTVPLVASIDLTGQFITTSARDLAGNTSEFSSCVSYAASSNALFANGFE